MILMDVQLPEMDGLSYTRQLKTDRATARITIVALTAYAMTGHREQTLAAGCTGYIPKLIDSRTFGHQVEEFLPRTLRASSSARAGVTLSGA